jgi:phosphoesterase RecJ-like protein
MERFEQFKKLVDSPKKIVITTHYKPDADALGSSLALANYFKAKEHVVSVISPSDYPDFLNWMEGNSEVINFEDGNEQTCQALIQEADIIFCIDFNSLKRINSLGKMVTKAEAIKVLIDHHLDPERFANFELWDTKFAASAELVYQLIVDLGDRKMITPSIAECLYAGIMTDTGQFKHPNTTRNVHLVTAELMDLGADVSKVGALIYDNNSLHRLKFIGFALSKKLTVLSEYRTAYFAISAQELKQFHFKTGDTEGLVNYGLSLKNVVLAAVIIERPDGIRISLRSRGKFSVNEFARNHFDGGGHSNAAGGTSHLGLEETVNKFISILKNYQKKLNNNLN